jgi:DNA-binding response OmpR family regulator
MKVDTKIEIIDDEEDLCFLLKLGLNKSFSKIEYTHTLKDGLTLFEKTKPNWLILDNNLPDALGWQHVNKFLAINDEVNVIYISANPDSVIDTSLKNSYHFIKPLDIGKITELILSKHSICS